MQLQSDIGNPRARAHGIRPQTAGNEADQQTRTERHSQTTKKSPITRWRPAGLLVIAVLIIGTLLYGYMTTKRQLAGLKGNGQSTAQAQTTELVAQIGQHIELPAGTPTVATVKDVSKLKAQEFFKNAQNGDKVLIYAQEGRALLYRPSTGKVIEYSKVNLSTQQTQATP
ncbi:MAG TPA: hypothetical protein VLE73_01600 [Candidatus Saccharimonadales bacterium]|nr:hypothetical protein [Candidatus Saccharimonadales bacterium]